MQWCNLNSKITYRIYDLELAPKLEMASASPCALYLPAGHDQRALSAKGPSPNKWHLNDILSITLFKFRLLSNGQRNFKLQPCSTLPLQCLRYQSQRTLFKQLRENRTKIAVIGSGCTLATEPAADISHFWNIPQVE